MVNKIKVVPLITNGWRAEFDCFYLPVFETSDDLCLFCLLLLDIYIF